MLKGAKQSFIKQIELLNKSPEKSTPSPNAYKSLEAWRRSSMPAAGRVTHTIKTKESRTTFAEE
jgi:hypothetical protein